MRRVLSVALLAATLVGCGDRSDARREAIPTEGVDQAGVLTPEGIGEVRIGESIDAAVAAGDVVNLRPYCEYQQAEAAFLVGDLAGALEGGVYLNGSVVSAITITRGAATPEGMAPGDHLDTVSRRYPARQYDVETDMGLAETFDAGLVSVTQDGTPLYQAWVDPTSEILTEIATPHLTTCD